MIAKRLLMKQDTEEGAVQTHAPTRLPPTSLIICSRNRPKLLLDMVESVLQGEEVPTELIIVDQSDAPHPTLPALQHDRACEIRYLLTQSVGLSRARNVGIAAARHDILVFTDDDLLASRTWFGSVTRALVDAGTHAVVTGRVLATRPEAPGGFVLALAVNEISAVYRGRIGTDVLAGCQMAMYRSTIEEVGTFDERLGAGSLFQAAEDNDFGFRVLEAGYHIVYAPEAVLLHRAWRSGRDYLPMRWKYGRGKGGFYTKYLSLRDRYMLRRMAWDIGHRILGFPLRLWREPRRACGDAAYIAGILVASTQWLLTQRRAR